MARNNHCFGVHDAAFLRRSCLRFHNYPMCRCLFVFHSILAYLSLYDSWMMGMIPRTRMIAIWIVMLKNLHAKLKVGNQFRLVNHLRHKRSSMNEKRHKSPKRPPIIRAISGNLLSYGSGTIT